jgi:Fe-S oxidoreductase
VEEELAGVGARPLCCGRTYLAAGQTGKARREAACTIETLLPYVQSGARIVGLEPSCVLTFSDEFFSAADQQKVQQLAQSAFLIEEVLADDLAAGRRSESRAGKSRPANVILPSSSCYASAKNAID